MINVSLEAVHNLINNKNIKDSNIKPMKIG